MQLSTGAGKTAIFCTILKSAHEKGRRCIMVVRGRSLVDQASRRLADLGVPHGVLMANHPGYNLNEIIQIASIDTCMARDAFPHADLIVIDEAHMAVSKTYKEFLQNYGNAYWLSVTATPWHKEGLAHLATDVVYPISMQELIDQGYLVRARYFVPSTFDASKIGLAQGEFSQQDSIAAMMEQKIHGSVVENYVKNVMGNGRTFVFAVNVNHANILRDEFALNGVGSVVITAETDIKERSDLIAGNELIISVSTLTTGVDVPDLKNIIFARPTMSKNLYVQMLGRGTRPYPGKEFFTVYDHVGNVQRHGFISDEDKADLLPKRKREKKQGEAPVKVCVGCEAVIHASLKVCPECKTEQPVNKERIATKGKGGLIEIENTPEKIFERIAIKAFERAEKKGYKPGSAWFRLVEKLGQPEADKHKKIYFKLYAKYKKRHDLYLDHMHGRIDIHMLNKSLEELAVL